MTELDRPENEAQALGGEDASDLDLLADADLRACLAAYAEAVLEPDPAAVTRMRAAVMREARRTAAATSGDLTPRRGSAGRRVSWRAVLRAPLRRRPAFAMFGAVVMVAAGAGAALAASVPGGPLYPVRLWAETLTLPTDPSGRTDAELARLRSRLAEASAASAQGNVGGVTAALGAYRAELGDVRAAAGTDPGRLAAVARELVGQRETLIAVADHVPPGSDPAISTALHQAQGEIDAVLVGGRPIPTGSPGAPGAGRSPGPPAAPGQGQGPGQPSGPPSGPPSSPPGQQPRPTPGPGNSRTPGPSPRPSSPHPTGPPPHPTGPPPHPTASPRRHGPSSRPSAPPSHKPHPTPRASHPVPRQSSVP